MTKKWPFFTKKDNRKNQKEAPQPAIFLYNSRVGGSLFSCIMLYIFVSFLVKGMVQLQQYLTIHCSHELLISYKYCFASVQALTSTNGYSIIRIQFNKQLCIGIFRHFIYQSHHATVRVKTLFFFFILFRCFSRKFYMYDTRINF